MNATSQDIKDFIEAESSLGLVFKTNLFISREPTTPEDTVTIFDAPGRAPQVLLHPGSNYYYDSVQIRVRSRSYQTGWALAEQIRVFLHGKHHEEINSTHYESIVCSQPVMQLDWDDNNRVRFVMSFEIQRQAV